MSNARNLANSARITLGSLAALNTVSVGSVTGLGALATLNTVGSGEISDSSITAAKLGTNEKRQLVRAFGYINGSTGSLVAGYGLTSARTSTGNYTVTLDSAAPDTNYTVIATAAQQGNQVITEASDISRTSTVVALRIRQTATGAIQDVPYFSVAILW